VISSKKTSSGFSQFFWACGFLSFLWGGQGDPQGPPHLFLLTSGDCGWIGGATYGLGGSFRKIDFFFFYFLFFFGGAHGDVPARKEFREADRGGPCADVDSGGLAPAADHESCSWWMRHIPVWWR
jgi:hypothetical protein